MPHLGNIHTSQLWCQQNGHSKTFKFPRLIWDGWETQLGMPDILWLVAKVLVFKRIQMMFLCPLDCCAYVMLNPIPSVFVHFNPCVGVPISPGLFSGWIHFLLIKSTCYCRLHPCQLDRHLGLDPRFVNKIHLFSIYCISTQHFADQIPVLIGSQFF